MNARTQILADQAARAEGENHTENTVRNAARSCTSLFAPMSASVQRQIFGAVVFGRRRVRCNFARGGFDVKNTVAYGQDYNIQFWTYAEIAALLNKGETVVGKRD